MWQGKKQDGREQKPQEGFATHLLRHHSGESLHHLHCLQHHLRALLDVSAAQAQFPKVCAEVKVDLQLVRNSGEEETFFMVSVCLYA